MADRKHVRKTSRYAPYVAPSTSRDRYDYDEESNDCDVFESLESELNREHERLGDSIRDCDETILPETSRASTNTENLSGRMDPPPPPPFPSTSSSSSSAGQQRSSSTATTATATTANRGENLVPQIEDWNDECVVGDEAYFSDNDISNVLDDSSDEASVTERACRNAVIDSQCTSGVKPIRKIME